MCLACKLPSMIVRMASFVADLRYCLRVLSRSPGFALVVVLTLGICIGANTAIFSAVNAILIQPLRAPHSERLVRLYQTNLQSSNRGPTSIANLLDWQHENEAFSGLAGYAFKGLALQDRTGAEGILSAAVSPNYFAVLGLTARFGRTFNLDEDQSGHDHVVILSDRLCRRLYGDETDVIGKSLRLNGESYVAIGVMPDTVTFPNERVEAWVPLSFSQDQLQSRGNNWVSVVGRLKDGVSFAQTQQAMSTLAHRLASRYPDALADHGIELNSLHQDTVGDTRPTLLLLQATAACVLLIACLNVANLLLTRAVGRRKEIATRSALGASRVRLIRQLLTESALFGLGSGCIGVLLAEWGIELLSWLGKSYLHRLTEVRIDAFVLGFVIVVSLLVGIITGVAPVYALCGKRAQNLQTGFRENRPGSIGARGRSRRLMVVFQLASAVIVLTCAGLLLRSFWHLQSVQSGVLEPEQILTATIRLPPARYRTGHSIVAFYSAEQARVSELPGVKSAGAINDLPFGGSHDASSFQIEGRPTLSDAQRPVADNVVVSGNYFQTAGIPLLAGRLFDQRDASSAPRTILVNQTFASRFFKDTQDAIGNRINNGTSVATIIGVVGDVHQYSLAKTAAPEIYYPVEQSQDAIDIGENDAQWMTLVIRADPAMLVEPLRKAIAEIDPDLPLYQVRLWSEIIADSIGDRRLNVWLVGSFALVALLLAALGLYGIVSYSVIQRGREIGVRMALGAQSRDVIRLIMWDGTRMLLCGVLIGTLGSIAVSHLLQGQLYQVAPNDPATLVGVILLLGVVALMANYLPARRAASIDPVRSLNE
jgi:putative ABC transport system permease protein